MIEKIDGSIFGRKIYHILGNDVIGLRYAGHAEFHSLGFIHSQFPMTAMADKEPEKNVLWNEVHIAKLNGRVCGAKRPHSVFEQSICYLPV